MGKKGTGPPHKVHFWPTRLNIGIFNNFLLTYTRNMEEREQREQLGHS